MCDEEVDLQIEASEAEELGKPPESVSRFYAKVSQFKSIPFIPMKSDNSFQRDKVPSTLD